MAAVASPSIPLNTNAKPHMGMESRLPRTGAANGPAPALWKGFIQGSVGAMVGSSFAHPLDLIKVRLQLQGEGVKQGMFATGSRVLREEGALALLKGIDAGAARQLVYSGTRFGMYGVLKRVAGETEGAPPLSMATKVTACSFLAMRRSLPVILRVSSGGLRGSCWSHRCVCGQPRRRGATSRRGATIHRSTNCGGECCGGISCDIACR